MTPLPAIGVRIDADPTFLRANAERLRAQHDFLEIDPAQCRADLLAEATTLLRGFDLPVHARSDRYSLGATRPSPRRQDWLQRLDATNAALPLQSYTEHLGIVDFGDQHLGVPLPVPPSTIVGKVIATTAEPLRQRFPEFAIANGRSCFALGDPRAELEFLAEAAAATDAALTIDLTALWCHGRRAGLELDPLIAELPDCVTRLVLSGCTEHALPSGEHTPYATSNGGIPSPVRDALALAARQCTNLVAIIIDGEREDQDDSVDQVRRCLCPN